MFHSIIYDHKDYNRDLNSDIPGIITRIGPPQGGTRIGEKDPMSILDVNWAGKLISKGSEAVG